jgi:hypothetical protein
MERGHSLSQEINTEIKAGGFSLAVNQQMDSAAGCSKGWAPVRQPGTDWKSVHPGTSSTHPLAII